MHGDKIKIKENNITVKIKVNMFSDVMLWSGG
jgi:hypothetical protein